MIHGLDISHWQGKVDFHAVKDNADFVIIKATQGNGYKDANYEINRDGARAVGLCVGFYHYAYPQFNQPQAEADWFTKNVSCLPGEILVLDFEESYPNPVGWCKAFLDRASSNMGFKPLIYLNLALIRGYDWSPVVNAGYGLWLAHYDDNPEQVDTTDWTFVAMKQYTSKGTLGGLTPVDLDSFYGTVEQFKKYGNPPPIVNDSNCDSIKAELEALKLSQNDAIKQAVATAIAESDAKWQSKLDSANVVIDELKTGLSYRIGWGELLSIIAQKVGLQK